MARKKNNKGSNSIEPADTESSLQNELSREAAEGADSIGDVASNRTLSGSSSWETLPEKGGAGPSTPKSGKASGPPGRKKNSR